MLRSRSNRKQFPSESTDERHGHGRTLSDYNGYPLPKPISPLDVTIGCDDDIESSNYSYNYPSPAASGYSNGGVVRRSPSYGSNGAGAPGSSPMSAGAVGSPMAGAGGSNGSFRKSLPGYGNSPHLQQQEQRRSSSGSSFGERIGSPIKSPRQLQQYHNSARRSRRAKIIVGLAMMASFTGIVVWKLSGGAEETTLGQYSRTVMNRIEHEMKSAREQQQQRRAEESGAVTSGGGFQDLWRIGWKALFSAVEGKADPTAFASGGDGEGRVVEGDEVNNNAIQQVEQLQHQKLQLEQEIQLLKDASDRISTELQSQHSQLSDMQLKLQEEEAKLSEYHNNDHGNGRNAGFDHQQLVLQEQQQREREEALQMRIKVLSDNLGKESRREVIDWFGPGPHVVEVYVEFPQFVENTDLDQWPRVRGTLRLEMAPLDLMPVAVNLFLQQIYHGLWNGCAFVVNAEHILQAGPHQPTPDGKEYSLNSEELLHRFTDAGLLELPYQEYRDEYPHEPYTIGYAGRPGGSNWYINKVNNTINHGPGGQQHHSLNEEADPCFAKLVGGWEVLELVQKIPIDADSRLLRPVMIVDSRVIGSSEERHHWQEQQHGEHDEQHHLSHEEQHLLEQHHLSHEEHHLQEQHLEHHIQHEQHPEQEQDRHHSPEEQHELLHQYEQHHEQEQQQYR